MKGIQLPVVSNNATTGHKLQGSSVDSIFVHAWIYEKLGLCGPFSCSDSQRTLRHPLDFDLRRYAVPPRLKEMLLSLENRHCMPPYFEDEDYQILHTLDSNN
jgi:hypothetical protein